REASCGAAGLGAAGRAAAGLQTAAKYLRRACGMRRPYFTTVTRRVSSSTRGDERVLDLVHDAERVPASLLLPNGVRATPAVLLLHGFSSSKERMTQSVGRALQSRGVASLALDLP